MSEQTRSYLKIVFGCLVLFLPFLGAVHLFDWDEINFAESAREMIVSGNYRQVMVNYEPFWEKPPLFFWFQVVSMKMFGIGDFAARFPNFLVAVATFFVIFNIGTKIRGEGFAWWWVLLYAASFTPHLYFHSGIIDPLFNLLIFLSVYQLYRTTINSANSNWLISGLFLGLAILTKGPVAALIVGLVITCYWVLNGYKFWFKFQHLAIWVLTTTAIASIWFLPEIFVNGFGFLQNFLAYQIDLFKNPVASHGQPWYYHFVVLAIGCLPASIIFLPALTKRIQNEQHSFTRWMKLLFWVVLILFSLVTTKIVHYSSMCYLPLTFLAAITISDYKPHKTLIRVLSIFGFIWFLILLLIPFVGVKMSDLLVKYGDKITDDFLIANLSVDAGWSWYHFVPALIFGFSLFWFLWGWVKNEHRRMRMGLIYLSIAISITLALIAPAIEKHTQNSVISFYTDLQDEDVYVEVFGFKSYAHYFYARVKPLQPEDGLMIERRSLLNARNISSTIDLNEQGRKEIKQKEMGWLMHGEIDKPVYIICKAKKIPFMQSLKGFKMVMNEGGFAVFRRWPQ